MKVIVGEKTYGTIKALTFAPETALTCDSLPINEFTADLITPDRVEIGRYAELRDDLDKLWAKYWIVYAEHLDTQTLRIRAQSPLKLLDQDVLPATMYEDAPIEDVLVELFAITGAALGLYIYTLDPSFDGETVTGFCPEQTARERLLWVCFALGAYVRTFFTEGVEILPVDDAEALIPMEATYWKPSVTFSDYVTAVQVTAYSFIQGTPSTTDAWVQDANGVTYMVSEQLLTLRNPEVPASAPENVVSVEGVYLLNTDNASGALTRMAQRYFKRIQVDMAAIDNGEYQPGDRVVIYADEATLYTGYIEGCDFAFGVQAKARLRLTGVDPTEAAPLTVTYLWEDMQIGVDNHVLPVGYEYELQARFIDLTPDEHRYIFRPTVAIISGTLPEGGAAVTDPCEIALDHFEGVLEVVSVDGMTETEGIVTIN